MTVAGALSFLPGGLGVTEAGMLALLVTFGTGVSRGTAAAATFVTRASTLWFAVALGLPALVRYARRKHVEITEMSLAGSGVRDYRRERCGSPRSMSGRTPSTSWSRTSRPAGTIKVLDRAKEMVRLGDSTLHKGVIPPEVFRRGLDALKALRRIADRHKVDALVAVATSAVREAQNGGEFVRAARDEVGIDVRVIRGDEEARLIYLGARGSLDLGKRRVALFDLGGGSLEVILADAQELYFTASLKLGVIRLAESYPCADPPELARARAPGRAGALRCWSRSIRACARWASTSWPSPRAPPRRWPASCAPIPTRTAGQDDDPVPALARARAAARDGDARHARQDRRARCPPHRHRSTRARWCSGRRSDVRRRRGRRAVRDGATRGDHRRDYVATIRPGVLLVDEFPDLRRPDSDRAGAPLPVPRDHGTHVARLALRSSTRPAPPPPGRRGRRALEYAAMLHDIGFYISRTGIIGTART